MSGSVIELELPIELSPRAPVEAIHAPIPRDYTIGPVFAAIPQPGPRSVSVGGKTYTIGVDRYNTGKATTALDVRHARALLAIMTFWDKHRPLEPLRFSTGSFLERYGSVKTGEAARRARILLQELEECFFSIREPNRDELIYRIVQAAKYRKPFNRPGETWVEGATLTPEFLAILDGEKERVHERLDILRSIPSPIAQALYLYIPSRAIYYSSVEAPFSICLSNLLVQVGVRVPPTKSERKRVFEQNAGKRSGCIRDQLDGLALRDGHLRVHIAPCANAEDYKLQCWVERTRTQTGRATSSKEPGALVQAWQCGGGSPDEFKTRIGYQAVLDDYDRELLERGRIDVSGCEPFLRMVKSLIGPLYFTELLAEAKAVAIEEQDVRSPTGLLISRLLIAVKNSAERLAG